MLIQRSRHSHFEFGSLVQMSDQQRSEILPHLSKSPASRANGLLGRAAPQIVNISGLGDLVIKSYLRGGLRRFVLPRTYFGAGASRAEREALLLKQVHEMGVLVPEVICFVKRGGIFYQNWLITRLIKDVTNLAELSLLDEERARIAAEQAGQQILTLVKHALYHVDLHPGNVLVRSSGEVYLIDFDKATYWPHTRRRLADEYLIRWRRAVIKHSLPEFLNEIMSYKLRSCIDEQ